MMNLHLDYFYLTIKMRQRKIYSDLFATVKKIFLLDEDYLTTFKISVEYHSLAITRYLMLLQ